MVFGWFQGGLARQIGVVLGLLVLLTDPGTPQAQPPRRMGISFLVSADDSYRVVAGIRSLLTQYPSLKGRLVFRLYTLLDQMEPHPSDSPIPQVVILDLMDQNLLRRFRPYLEYLASRGSRIYGVKGIPPYPADINSLGVIADPRVEAYYDNGGPENLKNLILYILSREGSLPSHLHVPAPVKTVFEGIYHLDRDGAPQVFTDYEDYRAWYQDQGLFQAGGDWVGLLFYRAFLDSGQLGVVNSLIQELEAAGLNVLPLFGYPPERVIRHFLLNRGGRSRIRVLLSLMFRMGSRIGPGNRRLLAKLDVPVINLISLYDRSYEEWLDSTQGMNPLEVSWQITLPEINGLIQPTVVGTKERVVDEETGMTFVVTRPVPERIRRVIERVKAWINLQKKPNRQKRIGIIYYDYPPGKQEIGASYLNVVASLGRLIQELREQGYEVGEKVYSERELQELMLASGRNVGRWAPGELDSLVERGRVVLLPIRRYKEWLQRLPTSFVSAVRSYWGEVEDAQIMIWQDKAKGESYLVLPVIKVGNLVLAPQPALGWGQDLKRLYHSQKILPHHQYIAFYLWLKWGFKADALIHLGTHGTQEWLSGKETGLSGLDSPEVLIQDLPNLYIYVMDDVGEGLQAKRRGAAVIIDHLLPPLREGGLYQEYARLKELTSQHLVAHQRGNAALSQEYSREIKGLLQKMGLAKDLGLDLEKGLQRGCELIHRLDAYLRELGSQKIPYGLHTFGQLPPKEYRRKSACLILGLEPRTQGWSREELANLREMEDRLVESGTAELTNLLRALAGHYVPPGMGNDPLRSPDSLPSGRNFYAFDPEKIPRPEAWKIGVKMVEQMLEKYRQFHQGRYPEKVAVVLWATETIRQEGVSEAEILYLIGVSPVWDSKGKVIGLELIPRQELKRPRIDVLINPSGLYRDTFPHLLELLNEALEKVKGLKEKDNWIRRHLLRYQEWLLAEGVDQEEAERLASIRIFSEPSGTYGNKIAPLVRASGSWDDEASISEVFIRQVGHGYGGGSWGRPLERLFKMNLRDTSLIVHSRASNLYGLLDNDDFFSYVGGLALAVRRMSGRTPQVWITNLTDPDRPRMQSLARTLGLELRSRYLNPRWIEGMKGEGYAGAAEMAHYVDYLWGWQVTTPEALSSAIWEQTFKVYVQDKYRMAIKEFFTQNNPWAYQALTARLLETIRKGYWRPQDRRVAEVLAREYIINTVRYGVACCEHTCNNPALNQYALDVLSLPGLLSPQVRLRFRKMLQMALGKPLEKAQGDMDRLKRFLAPQVSPSKVSGELGRKKVVRGYELKEVRRPDQDLELNPSGLPWLVLVFILTILGLFIFGWMRRL